MTFDRIFVSEFNRAAYTAAREAAEQPGASGNPLIISGPAGLGKTQLLHAIDDTVRSILPARSVLLTTAQSFVDGLLKACSNETVKAYLASFLQYEYLLVDAAEILVGRPSTYASLLDTVGLLAEAGRQVVLVFSMQDPSWASTPGMGPRCSMIEGCLAQFPSARVVDVELPAPEERCALLRLKAEGCGLPMDEELCRYLAERTQTVAQIVGTVTTLAAHATLMNATPSIEVAAGILNDNR